MTNKATIEFQQVGHYGQQVAYQVIKPIHVEADSKLPENWVELFRKQESFAPDRTVDIIGGWSARRYRFTFVTETVQGTCRTLVNQIYGYTDDAVLRNDSQLYFNRALMLHRVKTVSASLDTSIHRIIHDSLILSKLPEGKSGVIRPQDILDRMSSSVSFADLLSGADRSKYADLRGSFTSAACKLSTVGNESPFTYVSGIQRALERCLDNMDSDETVEEVIRFAADQCSELHLEDNPVIGTLVRSTNYAQTGYVTYGELKTLYEVTETVIDADNSHFYTDPGGNDSLESFVANTITNAITTTMSEFGLAEVCLQSNLTKDFINNYNTILHTHRPLLPDLLVYSDAMENNQRVVELDFVPAVKEEVGALLGRFGITSIAFDADVSIGGDAVILVGLDGGMPTRFVKPMFANALMSGCLVTTPAEIERLEVVFSTLTEHVQVGDCMTARCSIQD